MAEKKVVLNVIFFGFLPQFSNFLRNGLSNQSTPMKRRTKALTEEHRKSQVQRDARERERDRERQREERSSEEERKKTEERRENYVAQTKNEHGSLGSRGGSGRVSSRYSMIARL